MEVARASGVSAVSFGLESADLVERRRRLPSGRGCLGKVLGAGEVEGSALESSASEASASESVFSGSLPETLGARATLRRFVVVREGSGSESEAPASLSDSRPCQSVRRGSAGEDIVVVVVVLVMGCGGAGGIKKVEVRFARQETELANPRTRDETRERG